MSNYSISIKPFGSNAILIEWPNNVEESILDDILQYVAHLKNTNFINEDWEFVPAYNSLTLISKKSGLHFSKMALQLEALYQTKESVKLEQKFLWRLPVCYDIDFGIDLHDLTALLNISKEDLISLHTQQKYTVYGIGFLPGFMYLGGLPKKLEVPRKATPRLKVAKGSVGMAGKQTGIYPQESPGGWNIIGSCPVSMFNINLNPPCFVSVGDKIQFYQISRAAYDLHKIESEVGIYQLEKIEIDA